jgi:hypothetical protein
MFTDQQVDQLRVLRRQRQRAQPGVADLRWQPQPGHDSTLGRSQPTLDGGTPHLQRTGRQ